MSYSTMPEFQISVVPTRKGVACLMCSFGDIMEMSWVAETTQEMVDHIAAHRRVGDKVPENIEEALRADDGQNYPKKPSN